MPRGNNNPAGGGDGKGDGTPSPFLLTPYTSFDNGARPLPAAIPAYLCPAIHINGVPYTGVPLTSGVLVNTSILVKNAGALGALVTARLYYADPTTAFIPGNLNIIGQQVVYVGALAQQETPAMPWTPPNTIPSHVCLLAEVTSIPADPAPGTFDVVNDRHYGQQNINVLVVKKGQKKGFSFQIANAGKEEAEFRVMARPVGGEALRHLEEFYKAEGISLKPEAITVGVVQAGQPQRAKHEFRAVLKPGEARLCQVMMDVPADLQPHQFFAVEVEQASGKKTDVQGHGQATLGIVAFAADE